MVEVETTGGGGGGFLGRGFCVFRFGGGIAFFFCKEGVFFGLFTCDLSLFGLGFISEKINNLTNPV